jgi:hypothetical protein
VRLEHTKINPRKAKLGFPRAAWPRAAWRSASDLAPAAAWRKSSGQGWWLPRFIVARVYVPTHPITLLKLNCIYLRDKMRVRTFSQVFSITTLLAIICHSSSPSYWLMLSNTVTCAFLSLSSLQ